MDFQWSFVSSCIQNFALPLFSGLFQPAGCSHISGWNPCNYNINIRNRLHLRQAAAVAYAIIAQKPALD